MTQAIINRLSDGNQLTQLSGSNVQENPFSTVEGQMVVSESETFWARLARLGRWQGKNWDAQTFAITSAWLWNYGLAADNGYRFYPKFAVLSADVDCQLGIQIQTGVRGNGGTNTTPQATISAFCKAGTPLVIPFNGEYYVEGLTPAGLTPPVGIYLGVNNAAVGGKFYGSIIGVEVTSQ